MNYLVVKYFLIPNDIKGMSCPGITIHFIVCNPGFTLLIKKFILDITKIKIEKFPLLKNIFYLTRIQVFHTFININD